MFIYLATRFENQKNLIVQRPKVEAIGHKVTSRWLDDEAEDAWREHAREYSNKDFEDIDASDMFLLDMTCDLAGAKGGHFVELGYAIKGGKIVWIIGKQPNVFCYHKATDFFAGWDDVYKALKNMTSAEGQYCYWADKFEKANCDDDGIADRIEYIWYNMTEEQRSNAKILAAKQDEEHKAMAK